MKIEIGKVIDFWSRNTTRNIEGCSQVEIRALENHYKLRLPLTYKLYLASLGKRTGGLLSQSLTEYRHLFNLKSRAMEDLSLCDEPIRNPFPGDSFIFKETEFSLYDYFICNGDDDPPVVSCVIGDSIGGRQWSSFTYWLIALVSERTGEDLLRKWGEEDWANIIIPGWDQLR